MISFECDYNNGAHPKVLENLVKHNDAKPTPYGFDEFSERAKQKIREACGLPDAQIFFLTGGTQTNAMKKEYKKPIIEVMPIESEPLLQASQTTTTTLLILGSAEVDNEADVH